MKTQAVDQTICPICDSSDVVIRNEIQVFPFRLGEEIVEIRGDIPICHCAICGAVFSDYRAEEARHAAACAHLGLLAPNEIRAIRSIYTMGPGEFAELSGIGRASLSRWENGQHFQTRSSDNLLYLLSFRENVTRLQKRARDQMSTKDKDAIPKRRFRQLDEHDLNVLKVEAHQFDPFASTDKALQCT